MFWKVYIFLWLTKLYENYHRKHVFEMFKWNNIMSKHSTFDKLIFAFLHILKTKTMKYFQEKFSVTFWKMK